MTNPNEGQRARFPDLKLASDEADADVRLNVVRTTQEYCILSELGANITGHRVTITSNGSVISNHNFGAEGVLVEHRHDFQPEAEEIVNNLQHTNVTPSLEEIKVLSAFRNSLLPEIKELEKQSRVLENSIAKLCNRVAEIRSIIIKKERDLILCRHILSPIRRLPLEILHKIFIHSKQSTPGERRSRNLNRPTPLVIGQVCHLWRQVSLNFPLLWDTIDIVYSPHPTSFYSILPETNLTSIPTSRILELSFRRSHPLPLTVSVRSRYLISSSAGLPIHLSLVNSIVSVAQRIESINIQAESKSTLEPLFSCSQSTFPALKSLILEIGDFEVRTSPITIFETCSSLCQVVLDFKPTPHPFRVRIPWGQLTHLDMLHGNQPIADATWRTFIRLLGNLEDGRFCLAGRVSMQGFDDPFLSNQSTVTSTIDLSQKFSLVRLHTLTIRFVGQELPQNRNIWLLRNLELSNIQNFHFSFVRASTLPSFFFWRTENLQGPLFPYLQNLKSFTLWAISISIPELIDVLKMTVSLEKFRVKAASKWTLSETRRLVNALILKNVNANGESNTKFAVAPSLKNLVVWADNLSKEQAQSYLSMITTRRLGEGEGKAFKMTLFCRKKLGNVPEGVMVFVEENSEETSAMSIGDS